MVRIKSSTKLEEHYQHMFVGSSNEAKHCQYLLLHHMVARSQSFSIFDLPNGQLIFQKWFCSSNPLDLANIVVLAKKQEKNKENKKENGVL